MNAPIWKSKRLEFSRPQPSDFEELFERYASDPEVTRYVGWPRHRSARDTLYSIQARSTANDGWGASRKASTVACRRPSWPSWQPSRPHRGALSRSARAPCIAPPQDSALLRISRQSRLRFADVLEEDPGPCLSVNLWELQRLGSRRRCEFNRLR